MKKIAALIGIFLLVISCSTESNEQTIHYEVLPVDSVIMPTEFYVDVENEITVKFLRPTVCHGFDGFYYEKDGFTRTVAIQSFVLDQSNCAESTTEAAAQLLKFKPTEVGTYLFKFWKGRDSAGADIFEEYSIVVQ